MQNLCCSCCCAPISSCSLAVLSHQCQHYLLLGKGAEQPHLGTGTPSHISWATCSPPSALGLLLVCRDPSGQESWLTSLGPGRTLKGAPLRPVHPSLLFRPSKLSPGTESERKEQRLQDWCSSPDVWDSPLAGQSAMLEGSGLTKHQPSPCHTLCNVHLAQASWKTPPQVPKTSQGNPVSFQKPGLRGSLGTASY